MSRAAHLVPPSFAFTLATENHLAAQERISLDALLQHRATNEDAGRVMGMLEIAIRAIRIARKHSACRHLDPAGLDQAEKVMHRAGHAIHRAKQRHLQHGRFGLDAADRRALIDAEALNADLRKPGVILRLVWGLASKEACQTRDGIRLMPIEQCSEEATT
jgi:hypothetical protein